MSYVLAYDLGTTGNKATLFRSDGHLVASFFHSYDTYFPNVNWVEQNPDQWWESIEVTTHKLLEQSKIDKDEIKAISFSGQMMGVVPIDKDGNLLRNAIIWADQRSIEQASRLEKIGNQKVYSMTGSRITPTYFGPKIAWIRDNQPEIYRKTFKFLFAKDYIIFRLTGIPGTDFSDASMSNIFDMKEKKWSEELVQTLQIDIDKLPDISSSLTVVGNIIPKVAAQIGLSPKTVVVRGAGDGAAATVGAGVFDSNEAYLYLGSSSWISTCDEEPFFDPQARTFNFCHPVPGFYCPTGTMQAGGASYQWAKNTFCDLEGKAANELNLDVYALLDDLIDKTSPGSNSLVFLPYLLGERSPRWNVNARGAFIGLSMVHTKSDLLRAVLEGVTFNLKIILDIFEKVGGFRFEKIRLIGGGAKGRNWRQIIADIFGKMVTVPEFPSEATSVGAAICGGLGVGLLSIDDAKEFVKDIIVVEPRLDFKERYDRMYEIFEKSYSVLTEVFDSLSKIR
ncbi:MAG TPA: xylulokinase [Pseudothermotoga sp.]|nr:xylulokinase [Pseudothermotoga sp.]HOK82995.1 xylulokinase [Pseudothermotoga sp.]HPP69836.1 xylulokinase [Pseudothermotoga sp.]